MARLIDAEEVVKAVHDEFDECLVWDESGATTANEFENIILQVPTVDIDAITESHERIGYDRGFRDGYAQATSEVKHGHWILSEDRYFKTCSECGAEVDVSMGLGIFVDDIRVDEMNYCPNCGAHMEVEDGVERK